MAGWQPPTGSLPGFFDAAAEYALGETVEVEFVAGHPNNDLHTQGSYLAVERRDGDAWTPVAHDWDWETRFAWKRNLCFPTFGCSYVTITWQIPADATPGTYRIHHYGDWKSVDGDTHPYEGVSREFAVR